MNEPPILPGCEVLPPDDAPEPSHNGKARSKLAKPKTADRFAILNMFVDVTMGELSRAEIVAWMILYRDTREGTARTSQADIARRGGMDASTAKRAIRRLARRGLLRAIYCGGLNKGPSRYIINPAKCGFAGGTHAPSAGGTNDPSTGGVSCQKPGAPTPPIP